MMNQNISKILINFLVCSAKVFVRKLDAVVFNSQLIKRYSSKQSEKNRREFDSLFQNAMWVNYHQTTNPISALCDLYGSDKGSMIPFNSTEEWPTHNYADLYHHLFSRFRYSIMNVFECGIGSENPLIPFHFKLSGTPGASLRVWRDYFPQANIYGADIDPSTLFQEDRIKTFQFDQTSKESCEILFSRFDNEFFDIMIDDGFHEFYAGSNLFMNSIDKLSPSGWYIIEDVLPRDLKAYEEFFRPLKFRTQFISMKRDKRGLPSIGSNSLIVIEKILE